MIHVFNGCSEACNACHQCCENCGCCEEWEKCLSQCCNCVDKPLGSYVVVGMLVSLAEMACCILAFQEDFSQCQLSAGFAQKAQPVAAWGSPCFAWLNFIFPLYLQHEVLRTLEKRAGTREEMSQKEVKELLIFSEVSHFQHLPL
eukprot:symbB.v1.2.011205.t1/scaffold718.1/size169569/11